MNKTRIWIYCRVSERGEKCLLNYQESILWNLAEVLSYKAVGITKEQTDGKHLNFFAFQSMLDCIYRKRICIYEYLFEEFKMLFAMKKIYIVTLRNCDSLSNRVLFSCSDQPPPPSSVEKRRKVIIWKNKC